ncbi:uncharacterized protein LOC144246814 [Lonchura striata]
MKTSGKMAAFAKFSVGSVVLFMRVGCLTSVYPAQTPRERDTTGRAQGHLIQSPGSTFLLHSEGAAGGIALILTAPKLLCFLSKARKGQEFRRVLFRTMWSPGPAQTQVVKAQHHFPALREEGL